MKTRNYPTHHPACSQPPRPRGAAHGVRRPAWSPAAGLVLLAASLLPAAPFFAAREARAGSVDVLTAHYDNAKTSANLREKTLTPANVNPTSFGRLFSLPVDGQVAAQPLYLSNLPFHGQGARDVLFVATEHDSVYAFDAQSGALLWQRSFLDPAAGVTSVPYADVLAPGFQGEYGVTGTPVIDPQQRWLYVVAKTREGLGAPYRYVQRLHALELTSGQESPVGPVEIRASVPGVGWGSDQGVVTFDPFRQFQRGGLTLADGVVYVPFASHGDIGPYHGWILAYDATTLQLTGVFNDTPNGAAGGIWQSGAGLSVDDQGFLYGTTGNGDTNPAVGNYGDAVLKLTPAAGGRLLPGALGVVDFFVPNDYAYLDAADADLGSAGVLLLPDQPGPHPHLAVTGGKQGYLYLLNRDDLGQLAPNPNPYQDANDDRVVERFETANPNVTTLHSTPSYFNGTIYYARNGEPLKSRLLTNGLVSQGAPTSQTNTVFPYPPPTPVISADGTDNGIVWALELSSPSVLHAFDAADLGRELYRDSFGAGVRFNLPTVADGLVAVPTQSSVEVYGLLDGGNGKGKNKAKKDAARPGGGSAGPR